MKLIIDIPDEDYKFIKDLQFYNSGRRTGRTIENNVINGIKTGIPYEERSQSKWIEVDIKPMPYGGYTCNRKCNKCDYFTKEYRLNFCPNCGAEMRKGGAV